MNRRYEKVKGRITKITMAETNNKKVHLYINIYFQHHNNPYGALQTAVEIEGKANVCGAQQRSGQKMEVGRKSLSDKLTVLWQKGMKDQDKLKKDQWFIRVCYSDWQI